MEKDYISIEYQGGDNLFILASALDQIAKYASANAKKPKLHKLGGNEWKKTKSRVRGQVKDIARIVVASPSVTKSKTFSSDLRQNGLVVTYDKDFTHEVEAGQIVVTAGKL